MTCPLLQQNLQHTGRGGSRHLSCDALSGAEAREGCAGCFHGPCPKCPHSHTTLITARPLSRLGLGASAVYLNPPGAEQTSLARGQLCRMNLWGLDSSSGLAFLQPTQGARSCLSSATGNSWEGWDSRCTPSSGLASRATYP